MKVNATQDNPMSVARKPKKVLFGTLGAGKATTFTVFTIGSKRDLPTPIGTCQWEGGTVGRDLPKGEITVEIRPAYNS